MIRVAAFALTTILALAGCGGEAKDAKTDGLIEAIDKEPACSAVWVDGKTLPKDYAGCNSTAEVFEAAVTLECDSGAGTFTTFDDRFYALLGGTIHEYNGDDDASYAKAYDECFADPS